MSRSIIACRSMSVFKINFGVVAGLLARLRRHLLSQAQRPHVRPHILNIGYTVGFRTGLSEFFPAKWRLTIGEPDRVLFFVINHNLIDRLVFLLFSVHFVQSSWPNYGFTNSSNVWGNRSRCYRKRSDHPVLFSSVSRPG
jgi:hypothetical protein